jgi:hypothetical protein
MVLLKVNGWNKTIYTHTKCNPALFIRLLDGLGSKLHADLILIGTPKYAKLNPKQNGHLHSSFTNLMNSAD